MSDTFSRFRKLTGESCHNSFNLFHRHILQKIERYGSFTPEHYLIIHSVDCQQSFFFFRVRMGSCSSTRETPLATCVVIFVSCAFCSTS